VEGWERTRVMSAQVARLATVRPDGRPHLVPVTFALDGERVVTAVDQKPKRTTALQRLRNIEAQPAVSVLVDGYDDDWTRLWWVRLDGLAQVVAEPDAELLAPLLGKYPQYADAAPQGPAVVVQVSDWTSWHA
jgi:PPOX class probable F420-dependent enzyme